MKKTVALVMQATGVDAYTAQMILDVEEGRRPDAPPHLDAKGGPGSGNFGHAGRPGLVGGSAPGNGRPRRALADRLEAAKPAMAAAAQEIYDGWDPDTDPEYGDPEVGFGGVCDRIADAIGGVIIRETGADVTDGGQDGDDHAYIIAYDDQDAWAVDIPPSVYERGGGYSWQKIPGVQITADDVVTYQVDREYIDAGDSWDAKGGPGSGNFGHAGRPGFVGGSAPSSDGHAATDESPRRRLRDGVVPFGPISREQFAPYHSKWTPEQVEAFCKAEEAKRDANVAAVFEKRAVVVQAHNSEAFNNAVRSGREAVRRVHAEVAGATVAFATAGAVRSMMRDDDVTGYRGFYSGRTVSLTRIGLNRETYLHEYGHFIDNMLGTLRGRAWASEDATDFLGEATKDTRWIHHEGFAEFYSAWIRSGADPGRTYEKLKGEAWGHPRALVDHWDAMLRDELEMRV